MNWVARWNEGRPYGEQIRPFEFLLAFMPKKGLSRPFAAKTVEEAKPGRPPGSHELAPIAPYDSDPMQANQVGESGECDPIGRRTF